MKKTISRMLILVLCLSMMLTSAFAVAPQGAQSKRTISYDDGSYMEITTTVYTSSFRSNSQYAEEECTYTDSSGDRAFTYTLKGWFSYDNKTSKATNAAASVDIAKSGWSLKSHNEYCSGNTAYGSATFSGPGMTRTVNASISCDKNGNIS